MLTNFIIFALSFIGIWIGSGLAIRSIERLSSILKVPSFAVSFLVLGLFTSMGELSVGINSIIEDDPEIFVGNMIGASIVIFMLIIPLLAITGNKIKITQEFQGFNLPASLAVISLPVILTMDGEMSRMDALIAIALFTSMIIAVQTKKGLVNQMMKISNHSRKKIVKEILKISFSVVTIFIASKFIVEQTLFFSDVFEISPFLISLLLISIGTNIPELSIVVRSAFMKNNDVAFGNYVGSASFNTLLLGVLTLLYGKSIFLTNSYFVSLLFLIVALVAFYHFSRSKNSISRKEGMVLLSLYFLFILTEFIIHSSKG